MKKLIFTLFIFAFLFPIFSVLRAETIQSFTSNIAIQKDGTIDVEEIIIYDFEDESRHGIFREIPRIKQNAEGKKYRLSITIKEVVGELGTPYQWSKEETGSSIKLKIGNPDTFVTGKKIYQIKYTVSGALTYFSEHDELYWNITGNDWDIPINGAHTRIQLPTHTEDSNLKIVCYTGYTNSTSADCNSLIQSGYGEGSTNKGLSAGEGLTVAFSFPKELVAVVEPEEVHNILENPFILLLLFLVGFSWYILLPFYVGYRWWRKGRDPKPTIGQASVWFDPPKTKKLRLLTPAETGTLLDEQADLSDIASTIVDLARRGFLSIVEDKEDYTLIKSKEIPKEKLQPFETILFEGIFSKEDSVNLKKENLSTIVSETKKELYTAVVREGFFDKNPESVRGVFIVIGVLAIMTGNIILFISCMIFGKNMPKKTMFGADQAAIGKALKAFLSSQEKFLKFQAEKMTMFEKLLPYAVAFGVEKIWAQRFSNLELVQPTWYASSSSTIQSVAFVNSLSNSIQTFKSAATPTSSSSGFSSGSSGGFSGGGGGGGGGGSW